MYLKIQKRTSQLLSKGNVADKPSQYVDMILFILIVLNIAAVCLAVSYTHLTLPTKA